MSYETNQTRGEFRYVFYAPEDLYDDTVAFYRDLLQFRVIGGFEHGVFLEAAAGVIEVIRDPRRSALRDFIFSHDRYSPPSGGWLLIEVPNVDEVYARVAAHSAVLQAPLNWEWGTRDFKVTDPCGNIVCLSSRSKNGDGERPSPQHN